MPANRPSNQSDWRNGWARDAATGPRTVDGEAESPGLTLALVIGAGSGIAARGGTVEYVFFDQPAGDGIGIRYRLQRACGRVLEGLDEPTLLSDQSGGAA